jgi:hypothetical protein
MARRNFLILPKFQITFIGWVLGFIFMVIGIFYGANIYFFNSYFQLAHKLGMPNDHVFVVFIGQQYQNMKLIFMLASTLTFVVVSIFGVLFSHRIAGPIYRFKTYLLSSDVSSKTTDLKFRSGDFFMDLAAAFNAYNKKITKMKLREGKTTNEK